MRDQDVQDEQHQDSIGLVVVIYVDDIIILATSEEEATTHLMIARQCMAQLGIQVNEKKSMAKPSHILTYLGYILDLKKKTITISNKKRYSIRHLAARELQSQFTTKKRLAKLLGVLQGSRDALPCLNPMSARLYRLLYNKQAIGWTVPFACWESCRPELVYWANLKQWQSINYPSQSQSPDIVVYSDASATG